MNELRGRKALSTGIAHSSLEHGAATSHVGHQSALLRRRRIGLASKMNPAASVFFFDNKFDTFLHAPIGADGNGVALSVLSALARLDVDPWEEAAVLSALSKERGAQRLAALISRLPNSRPALEDTRTIADGLISLLPRVVSVSKVPLPLGIQIILGLPYLTIFKLLVGAALATAFLMMVLSGVSPARADHSIPNVSQTEPIARSK